jgi:hypothetical protein
LAQVDRFPPEPTDLAAPEEHAAVEAPFPLGRSAAEAEDSRR